MVFHSIEEMKQYIIARSGAALQNTVDEVYDIIDKFVQQFYGEYSPVMYERTYQLLHSLVKTGIQSTGNGWKAYVYFDYSSLSYMTGAQPSGAQVMGAAASGGHGATGLYIVPGGTGIWDAPMEILKGQNQAIEILKNNLIAAGIPIG